eukprot:TRINITY_DN669_c0_g1_i4.p2 TRINITY_DN669_c0_g1~~TRINITY_DN669_c0_g1_i4.p2  ORF type:complete len:888 (-),score=115.93 TRINITY_DN669_c0_g1_i4:41-2704(-)
MFHQSGTAPTGITADLITFTKNATAFARQDRESLDEYFTFIMNIDRLYKLNRNMAQQFEQMTNELRKASLIFRKLSSNAMTIQKRKLKFIYKNIEAMLMNWSSLMESQWRHFREDFSNYFKYYLFEGEAILDLAKNTQVAEEKYLEKENELALLKHKLFQSKDLDKWKMQPEDRKIFEQTTLMHNKKLSFPKMLPDETKVVEEHFTRYGYYLNRMKAEVDRVVDTRVEEMFNHFAVVANNYAKSAKEMANVWMDFEEKIEPLEEGENVPKRMELHVHLNVEDETETEAEEIIKSLKGSVVEKNKELVVENKLNATVPVIIQENSREEEDKSSEGGEEDALMVGSKGLKKINSYPTEIMKKDLLGKRRGEISQYAIYEKVLRKDEKDMREVDEKRQLMEENGTPQVFQRFVLDFNMMLVVNLWSYSILQAIIALKSQQRINKEMMKGLVRGNEARFRALMDSASKLSKELFDFSYWAVDRGLDLHTSIEFTDYNHLGMGYGLTLKEPAQQGTLLFRFPCHSCISSDDDRSFNSSELAKIKESALATSKQHFSHDTRKQKYTYQLLMLTYKLLCYFRNKESTMKPYINSLPVQELPTLGHWQHQVLCELNSQSLINYIKATYKAVNTLYYSMFSKKKGLPLVLQDEFQWALSLAGSRYAPISPADSTLYLCPFVDYINHSFSPNAEIELMEEGEKWISVKSTREMKQGEQVLLNYGKLSNYALAQKYGFAVENNEYSSLPFMLECEKYAGIMRDGVEAKLELIKKHVKVPEHESMHALLYKDNMEPSIIPRLRIWLMTPVEVMQVFKNNHFDFNQKISKDNEARVKDCFSTILYSKLAKISKVNYKQFKSSLKPFKTIHDFNCYTAAILEEEEQEILKSNLKFIINLLQ